MERDIPKKRDGEKREEIKVMKANEFHRVEAHHRPRTFGTHGKSLLIDPRDDLDIVAVDPGIATLITAVRQHNGPVPTPSTKLGEKLAENDRSHFHVTNNHWRQMCGRLKHNHRTNRLHQLHSDGQLQRAFRILSQHSAKVSTTGEYERHMRVRMETIDMMRSLAATKAPKQWKFDCYREEQRAVKQLSANLLRGCGKNVVIAWGNDGFSPTYKGHASAPNKKLRRLLSKYVPVVLTSEFRSSKRSCCCKAEFVSRPRRPDGKRHTVQQCSQCKLMLSRDYNSASVILDLFMHQRAAQSCELPTWLH